MQHGRALEKARATPQPPPRCLPVSPLAAWPPVALEVCPLLGQGRGEEAARGSLLQRCPPGSPGHVPTVPGKNARGFPLGKRLF